MNTAATDRAGAARLESALLAVDIGAPLRCEAPAADLFSAALRLRDGARAAIQAAADPTRPPP